MRKYILALGLSLALAAPALGASAEKEVLAAMDAWKQAMIKKDKAGFEKIYHSDLAYGHSSGVVETKEQAIQHVLAGEGTYTAINFGPDTKVRVHGNTAFVTGKVDYLERAHGKDNVVNLVVLSVWMKSGPSWQMVARQATKPPPPAPAAAAGATPAKPATTAATPAKPAH
jgi:ketosteroid isomerase-like protein